MTRSGLSESHPLDHHLDRALVVWNLVAGTLIWLLVECHVLKGVRRHLANAEAHAANVLWDPVSMFSRVTLHQALGLSVPVTTVYRTVFTAFSTEGWTFVIWPFNASTIFKPVVSHGLPNDAARVEVVIHLLLGSARSTDYLAVLVRACLWLPVQQVVTLAERCEKLKLSNSGLYCWLLYNITSQFWMHSSRLPTWSSWLAGGSWQRL